MSGIRQRLLLAATIGLCLQMAHRALGASADDVQNAYTELTSADHWRKAKAASDKLGTLGVAALPAILKGTTHEQRMVREYSYQLLRSEFPKHQNAIEAILYGLNDKESIVSYPCAFHLGENRITEAKTALQTCMKDESKDDRTRYAAAKSLAELGDHEVMVMLYAGLGSDDHYTRYLSNIGIKALCGKDLTDFDYEGPWEGAFVSGPAVMRMTGQPIEKAKRISERWQAILKFLEWLEKAKPELFKELDNLW